MLEMGQVLVLELISPVLRNTEEIQGNKHFTSQKTTLSSTVLIR